MINGQKSEAHRFPLGNVFGQCFRKITVDRRIGSEIKSSEIRHKVNAKIEDNKKNQKQGSERETFKRCFKSRCTHTSFQPALLSRHHLHYCGQASGRLLDSPVTLPALDRHTHSLATDPLTPHVCLCVYVAPAVPSSDLCTSKFKHSRVSPYFFVHCPSYYMYLWSCSWEYLAER